VLCEQLTVQEACAPRASTPAASQQAQPLLLRPHTRACWARPHLALC